MTGLRFLWGQLLASLQDPATRLPMLILLGLTGMAALFMTLIILEIVT